MRRRLARSFFVVQLLFIYILTGLQVTYAEDKRSLGECDGFLNQIALGRSSDVDHLIGRALKKQASQLSDRERCLLDTNNQWIKKHVNSTENHSQKLRSPGSRNDGISDYIDVTKLVVDTHNVPKADGVADYINPIRVKNVLPAVLPQALAVRTQEKPMLSAAADSVDYQQPSSVSISNNTISESSTDLSIKSEASVLEVAISSDLDDKDVIAIVGPVVEKGAEAPSITIDSYEQPELVSQKDKSTSKDKGARKYHGVSGFVTLGNRKLDIDGFNLTVGASYKPIKKSYWFARTSWNYRMEDQKIRYTWGIGYDDWHPGTWAVQLNHWGPLQIEDGLDIENSVASITYKFNKNAFMKDNKLSSSITLSQKISGEPVLSWSNSWNPSKKWFIRSAIRQPIRGGKTNWSYGFGWANYSPFSFSFEYNNWGYNEVFDTNFQNNGSLSFTYRWRF